MSNRWIFHRLLYIKHLTVTNQRLVHNQFRKKSNLTCHLNDSFKCYLPVCHSVVNRNNHTNAKSNLTTNQSNKLNLLDEKCLSFFDIPTVQERRLNFLRNTLSFWPTSSWNKFHEHINDRHKQLGPIFREKLGPVEAVFVMAPDIIREVFLYEGKYPKHPLPEAWTFYNKLHDCKRGLFFMDDDQWLESRKLMSPLMLRNDDRFMGAISKSTNELIESWRNECDVGDYYEINNILSCLYLWSIKVLIGIMFGRDADRLLNEITPQIEDFARIVQDVFEDTVPFMTTSPQRAHKFHFKSWRKFENSVTKSLQMANDIIDYGIKKNIVGTDGLINDLKKLNVSLDMIKRLFIDLIIAAGDTTAFSTRWAMYLLATNETIQQTVRQEILENRQHTETPLIRGTVREALRMFPVATFIGRILGKDAILGGYKVDKFTLVLISAYSAGRDELSFPEADSFLPWRWNRDPITGNLEKVNRPQSTIPYALGARNCIGQKIANAQMHLIIRKILENFSIKLLNEKPVEIEMRLIIMPKEELRFGIKRFF